MPPSCLYEVSSLWLPSFFVHGQGDELSRWPYLEGGSQTSMFSRVSNRLTQPGRWCRWVPALPGTSASGTM